MLLSRITVGLNPYFLIGRAGLFASDPKVHLGLMLVLGSFWTRTTEFPLVWDGPKSEWKVNFFFLSVVPNALKVIRLKIRTHRYYKKQSLSRSNAEGEKSYGILYGFSKSIYNAHTRRRVEEILSQLGVQSSEFKS